MLDDEIAFDGVAGQAELIRRGDVSVRELAELVLGRIERLEPELNAFGAVFAERALLEADQADARARAGERRPLLGIPVGVKDEIDIAGEITSYGTGAMVSKAPADAEVVRRLRAAGAIVVGKTKMPEFGWLTSLHAGISLEETLGLLDGLLAEHGSGGRFATASFAEIDRSGRELRLIRAGHEPPLLITPDSTSFIDGAHGPVLGISAARQWPLEPSFSDH